jgi:hypothetical protein
MKYRFHRAATAEHYDNVNFYEDSPVWARTTERVRISHGAYLFAPSFYLTIGAPNIHKAGLKRFPFHVIYRAKQNQIIVLAVAHQRRQPAYWSGRLVK